MTATSTTETAAARPAANRVRTLIARYGVLAAIVLTFITFSVLRPDSFLNSLTLLGILRDCVPLMVLALGITVVMTLGQFDMSVGGLTSLMAVVSVIFVSTTYVGLPVPLAVLLTLVIGALLGLVNGIAVAYVKLSAFIFTIAMSTVFTGIGLQLTNSQSLFTGVPPEYVAIASGSVFGVSNQTFIGLAVLVVLHILMIHTQPGRFMYAIGGNREAARLAGVPVQALLATGFAVAGIAAALSGVLLTSQAGASNPSTGIGLLLPAYAAVFLGSSLSRNALVTPVGTAIGALFLQMIGSGLTLLNLSGPLVSIIQGLILVGAILLSRVAKKDAS
ncbi:ABC transporter permease [Herbiconiux sp. P15]|uniref:ABC transporter permease n=1 Tax=Herbiconiux liukaitaii TaxID=3342799 RepID=UPI0035BAD9A5